LGWPAARDIIVRQRQLLKDVWATLLLDAPSGAMLAEAADSSYMQQAPICCIPLTVDEDVAFDDALRLAARDDVHQGRLAGATVMSKRIFSTAQIHVKKHLPDRFGIEACRRDR